jgi:GT2 family glycosyltransferase
LHRLLQSVCADADENGVEIIVVDDDIGGVLTLPSRMASRHVRVLRGGGKGPAHARNVGASEAEGALLIFIDDDSVAPLGYLARIIACARRLGAGHAVAGPQHCFPGASSPAEASRTLLDWFTGIESAGERKFLPSNGLAIFRSDYQRAGGFDTRFNAAAGEDREFCLRLRKAGVNLVLDSGLALLHEFPSTVPLFLRQQWRYGRGARQYSRFAPGLRMAPRSLESYMVLLRDANVRGGVANALLCLAAQGLIVAGFAWECCTEL